MSDALRFHASVANSFRAPQATELYRLQRAQTEANLDSVEADNIEIGLRYRTDTTQLDISLYSLDLDNVIIRDSDFLMLMAIKLNQAALRFLYDINLALGGLVQLAAAVAEHEYASDQISGDVNINGNQVDTAPKAAGSLSLNWQPTEKFSARLQWQHLGSYFLEPENQREYPGHDVINLRAGYQVNARLRASLRVLNLGDTAYAERADFTGFTGERYFPGMTRSVFGGVEYRFE